jgi:CheY-like chemotaxis protein
LFADDSVTAQNMGKKILTEAGYDVVAVSNGAAAVKKIAEQKPDIIILDVYMPGYSGLEVCEKVRGSMETMKTPVLLTYGKLEHYKPEDGNRVKADGVIVKPFEASDLLAIVKKFEERLARVPVLVQQPVRAERFEKKEEATLAASETAEHSPAATVALQPTVEVPDHMATTAAFSDLLGAEPAVSANHFDPIPMPAVIEAPPPAVVERPLPAAVVERPLAVVETMPAVVQKPLPAVDDTQPLEVIETPLTAVESPLPEVVDTPVDADPVPSTIPNYEVPASWRDREPLEAEIPVTAAEPPPMPAAVELEPQAIRPASAARPLQIPVYQETEAAEIAYEIMPTSAPPLGEIELPREPQLQETAAEATRNTVADAIDPGLLSTRQQFEQTPFHPDEIAAAEMAPLDEEFTPSAGYQDIPAEISSHLPPPAMEVVQAAPAEDLGTEPVSDSDFEARVAAALAAYGQNHQDAANVARASSHSPMPELVPAPLEDLESPALTQTAGIPQAADTETPEFSPLLEAPAITRNSGPAVNQIDAAPHGARPSERVFAATAPAQAGDASPSEAEPIPTFEYRPPVGAPAEDVLPSSTFREGRARAVPSEDDVQVMEGSAALEPHQPGSEPPMAEALSARVDASFVQSIAEALPQAAGAAITANVDTKADHQAVAQAVHRVIERLKPELVEEILRELKSTKE